MENLNTPTPSIKFQVLSEHQCQVIYNAALQCLENIGVIVHNEEGRQLLKDAGARIEDNIVKIPKSIIQSALETAPNSFNLWSRDGESYLEVAPNHVFFGPGPTCTYFIDPETEERRHAQRGDAGLTARVCDALENIDFVMSLSLYNDVTPVLSPVYEFADMILNTNKPIAAWANDIGTIKGIHEIAKCVVGGEKAFQEKPNYVYFSTFHSPFHHLEQKLGTSLWAVEHGIPVVYLGGPTLGLEAPITAASGLVIFLASALSGLAMMQLKQPGAPVAIGGLPMVMDMFTARPSYGSPEMSLNTAAASELARYLDLPFMGTAGSTDSKTLDAQTGLEITSQILFSALSGAGLVHDVGFLDCADIGSLDLLVLANEVISYTKRIMRGISISQDDIMMELLEAVGPGGYFAAEPESVMRCRTEVWVPKLLDRKTYSNWEAAGELSLRDKVQSRLIEILENHQPPILPDEVQKKIQSILNMEEKRVME
jgi:trimethylamine--corrinoid protein Co-methyltransferase